MDQERVWIEQLQQGNPEGLRRIYVAYKDDLLTIGMCLLISRTAAEDCLHDVFVSLAGNAAMLSVRTSLKGYLIRVACGKAGEDAGDGQVAADRFYR